MSCRRPFGGAGEAADLEATGGAGAGLGGEGALGAMAAVAELALYRTGLPGSRSEALRAGSGQSAAAWLSGLAGNRPARGRRTRPR
jgi:hypothetical protein